MKLPIAGIFILMLLIVSGYVASEPAAGTDEGRIEIPVVSLDPHVNYYEQHLTAMGVIRPAP
jgi:hypothetical protein